MVTFFRKYLLKGINITIGCALMGFATGQFLLPNQLSTGGFSGIATILYYFFNIDMGLTTILLNIPFFIIAYSRIGKGFLLRSLLGTGMLALFLSIFENLGPLTTDRFLGCIYGAIFMGLGMAMVLRVEASTGGSDLIMNIIRTYKPGVRSSTIIVIVDTIIVLANIIFFKTIEIGLYSAIAIYIMGKILDIFFEGINFAKMMLIVSEKYQEISNEISKEIGRGVTGLYGKGMYTENEKTILLCVTSRNEVARIRILIEKIDPEVFLVISNAREVFGKGFKQDKQIKQGTK